MKKLRHKLDESSDLDDFVVNDREMKVDWVENQVVSWRDKLLMGSESQKVNTHKEDDFEFLDGDVKKEIINGIPTITFSEWVNQFIAKPMARTVIVKLLG